MTPKQKALELVTKYYGHFTSYISIAKKCALIAVDEILNVIIGSYDYELEKKYWQEVKQEIEKL